MLSVTLQAVRYWKIINFVLQRSKCHVITDNEREAQEGRVVSRILRQVRSTIPVDIIIILTTYSQLVTVRAAVSFKTPARITLRNTGLIIQCANGQLD